MEIIAIMSIFTRPVLQINLNNLVANYKKLREIAAPAVAAAVVKDNAYEKITFCSGCGSDAGSLV